MPSPTTCGAMEIPPGLQTVTTRWIGSVMTLPASSMPCLGGRSRRSVNRRSVRSAGRSLSGTSK